MRARSLGVLAIATIAVAGRLRSPASRSPPTAPRRRTAPRPATRDADPDAGRSDPDADVRPPDADPAADLPRLHGSSPATRLDHDRETVRDDRPEHRVLEPVGRIPSLDPDSRRLPAGLPRRRLDACCSSRTPRWTRRTCHRSRRPRPLRPARLPPRIRRATDAGRYRVAMRRSRPRHAADRRDRCGRGATARPRDRRAQERPVCGEP